MAATAGTAAPGAVLGFLGDERLARLAARGDRRAFDALFSRHQPGMARYCRGILRNDADADDAAQNAMVAALGSLESGTVPMRVKPWLYRIAHNEAISLVRRRRPEAALDEAALPAVGGPDEVSAVRERLGQLMTDLHALSERQRQALVLRELYDFSYTEIATTLGCSEPAAQQTVFEARSSLQHFDAGRALACEGVQQAMSACDGQRLRTRSLRAHVRGCGACSDFEKALRLRRRDLGLLFPPVGGAGGVLAALGRWFATGGGDSLVAGFGVKHLALGLAVLAGSGAAVGLSERREDKPAAPRAAAAAEASPAAAAVATAARSSKGATAQRAARAGAGTTQRKNAGRKRSGTKHGKPSSPASAAPGDAAAAAAPAAVGRESSPGDAGAAASAEPAEAPTGGGSGNGRGSSSGGKVQTTVSGAVEQTTGAVSDTVSSATQAVEDTVQQVTDTAGGAVDTVTQAAGDVTGTATGAVNDVTQHLPPLP